MKNITRLVILVPILAAASLIAAAPTATPTSAYQHYLKALLLESGGTFEAARDELGKAIEAAPDNAYLYRTEAELSLRLGQVNRAADEIEKANRLDPKDVKALILGGQIQWALGNAEKAEAKLKKAVALAPDESEATVSLAGALTPKEPKEAIKLYKNFLQRHPNDVEIWERLAQIYNGIGEVENAKSAWEKTLSWAPGSVRAHLALAQIAEVNRDTTTAIAHYEAVMADDPTNLPLLLRIGELRYRNNEMAKAEEAFSAAKTIAPDSPAANFWMALLAENRGDWNTAIALLEKVSSTGPDSGVLLRLSYYYSQAGRFPDAVKALEKLVETQPSNTDFLNYLAIAYEQSNQQEKAEKTLRRILEIDTANYEAHFQLATLYDRQGKAEKAETELKTAISLKPDYDVALNYLGYSYADRNIHLDEAEKMLTQALAIDPDNAAYLDSMGWLRFRKGELEKAGAFLVQASTRARDTLIYEHLGDVRAAQNDDVAAVIAYNDSMVVDPTAKSPKAKYKKALKRLTVASKAEVFARLAQGRYAGIRTIQSLISVKITKGHSFTTNAQFGYQAGEELRAEIPGPLSGPVMVLDKKAGQKAEYGAVHPEFQSAGPDVTRCFDRIEEVLSGRLFKSLEAAKLESSAELKKGHIVANGGAAVVSFDAATGEPESVQWTAAAGGDSVSITPSSTLLPAAFEWKDPASGVSLRIQFVKPSVSTVLERDVSVERAPVKVK